MSTSRAYRATSPECGVAVSSTTRRARRATAWQVSKRSESPQATWASSTIEQVPGVRRQRLEDVALLQEVRRGDPDPRAAPGVLAKRAGPAHRRERRAIGGDDGEREARAELVDPLIAQRRRHEQQDSGRRFAADELRHDESGLNGLAKPHVVCEQQPGVAGDGREHGRELIRQDVQPRGDGGQSAAGGPARSQSERPRALPPADGAPAPGGAGRTGARADRTA